MGYLGDYMVRVTIWKLNMNYLPNTRSRTKIGFASMEMTRPSFSPSFSNMLSLAFFTCFLRWWVHSFYSCSVFGGFFEQNSHFPRCALAARDDLFLGLPLFSTVVALWINFFPFLCK